MNDVRAAIYGRRDFSTAPSGATQTTGEFTPTVATSTGTVTLDTDSIVRWVIMGALATFNIHLLVASIAGPTGSFRIQGFPVGLKPFNGGKTVQGFMSCAVWATGMIAGAGSGHMQGQFFNGPPLTLTVTQLSGGSVLNVANLVQAGTNFEIMASYRVT